MFDCVCVLMWGHAAVYFRDIGESTMVLCGYFESPGGHRLNVDENLAAFMFQIIYTEDSAQVILCVKIYTMMDDGGRRRHIIICFRTANSRIFVAIIAQIVQNIPCNPPQINCSTICLL